MFSGTRAARMSPQCPRGLVVITATLLVTLSLPTAASASPLFEFSNLYDDSIPRGNGNGVIEAGEHIWHSIALLNLDDITFEDVSATLRSVHGATVHDGNSFFGTIPPGVTVIGDRFEFTVSAGVEVGDVLLEVTFDIPPFPPVVKLLELIAPGPPQDVAATGSVSSITLAWDPPSDTDILGYDIFRSPNPDGPFARVNESIFEGGTTFEDTGLPPGTTFYYRVVTRDQSYNASIPSAIVAGTTSTTGVSEPTAVPIAAFARLLPSVPNPFNPSTALRFEVPGEHGTMHSVRLAVYDIEGHLVRVLFDASVDAGQWTVPWDGRDFRGERVSGGTYVVKLESDGHAEHGKVVMIK